jgi:predicted nucleic acid-binding protein
MIIGDSSALITLAIIDQLGLLEKQYNMLFVPLAVYNEVIKIGRPQSDKLKLFLQDKVKTIISKNCSI